jgi:outer membrane protein TolC
MHAIHEQQKRHVARIFLSLLILTGSPALAFAQRVVNDSVKITLQQALQEALANNELLQAARTRVTGAEAAVHEAAGNRLPNLDATFSYAYLDIVPGFKSVKLGNIEHDFLPAIAIRQPLFTGGKLSHNKRAAEAGLEAQQWALGNEELNLKLLVALAYYQLQSTANQIGILQENRRQLEVQQQYARLLVQAGRMSELELNRLQVEIANTDGNLLKARNDYQLVSNNLAVAMGRREPQLFLPADSLTMAPLPTDTTRLLQTALEHNPLAQKFEWDLKQAQAKIAVQKAARLPQVAATAWYGYEFGLESFSPSQNDRYFVGLTAQMPLFDAGVISARVAQAEAQREQIHWQKEYFLKNLAAQVSNLHLRVQEAEERVTIQQQAVQQAEQSYRLALIEYHAGRRSNTDLLDIQKSLLNTRLQLNEAFVNYSRAQAQLLFTLGIL